MTNNDDMLDGAVPEPLDEASPSERAHARTFADIIDKAITGRAPAAMSSDDRALLEVATVIRAANGQAELSAQRQRSIVEDALRQAVGDRNTTTSGSIGVIPLASRRKVMPWAVAGASMLVAAAALLALWLRTPGGEVVHREETAQVPTSWTSRPADPLVGPIAPEHAGEASERIDYLFADRLDGYRERRLSGRGGAQ